MNRIIGEKKSIICQGLPMSLGSMLLGLIIHGGGIAGCI